MKRFTLFVSVLVALSVILSACAPSAPAVEAPAEDQPAVEAPAEPTEEPAPPAPKVLKIANTANITTWDPVASFSTEAAYMANTYEQLLRINPPGSAEEFTPLLAESWEANEDGTVWTSRSVGKHRPRCGDRRGHTRCYTIRHRSTYYSIHATRDTYKCADGPMTAG